MAEPVRTCIGCRRQAGKSELVRLVWRQGVVPDLGQREPGRGAYLHRGRDCLARAVRRRAVARALHVAGFDADALVHCWIQQGLNQAA